MLVGTTKAPKACSYFDWSWKIWRSDVSFRAKSCVTYTCWFISAFDGRSITNNCILTIQWWKIECNTKQQAWHNDEICLVTRTSKRDTTFKDSMYHEGDCFEEYFFVVIFLFIIKEILFVKGSLVDAHLGFKRRRFFLLVKGTFQ